LYRVTLDWLVVTMEDSDGRVAGGLGARSTAWVV
jgi:hypothetical protein